MRRWLWYRRSWNSGRRRLKPVVVMLAMLFEITSTLSCWAIMPVAATLKERMRLGAPSDGPSGSARDRDEVLDGVAVELVLGVDELLHALEGAHRGHEAGHLEDRHGVRALDRPLDEPSRRRPRHLGAGVETAALAGHRLLVAEGYELEPRDRPRGARQRAVLAYRELA